MKLYEAKNIIKDVFENPFNKEKFSYFVRNLLKNLHPAEFLRTGYNIPKAFENYIASYERIGKYEDEEGNLIDVLIVKLKRDHSIDYARSTQRNFIRWYLNDKGKDAALVAFHTDQSPDWRFSFIKMQYSLEKKSDELTPAKRSSYMVGESGKSHTAQRQFINLLKNDYAPYLSDIEEAFSIETVSDEFYEKYKTLLFDLVDEIELIIRKDKVVKEEFDSKEISVLNFAKKLLGQIVFLYFLQKKGWLGLDEGQKYGEGDRNFMRNLFVRAKRENKNFFNDYLEYLFYDALSKKRVTDYYERFKTRIPFLNGGLFDPIGFYDWQKTDIVIPNEIFSDRQDDEEGTGILDVFDLYNFTVKEDEPLETEVAIDPEMLGKVFERMLEVKERKSKGAFYTPREIVHYMAQQSLLYFLETELKNTDVTKDDLEVFIHYGEHIIDKDIAIEEGKLKQTANTRQIPQSIRDNAGAIDKALENIKICDPAVGSGAFPVGVMNEIVKLRKLLTPFLKIADKTHRTAYAFKSNAIQNSIYGVDIDAGAVEIAKLRLWLSMVVDENRIDTIEPLPNLDYKIMRGNSLLGYPFEPRGLAEIEKLKDKYFLLTGKEEKKRLKEEIDSKIWRLYENTSKSLGYQVDFDFKINFSEVKGFDIVIGNPPYVKEYTDKSAFNGTREQECYQGKMDLWYLFGCKGIDIIKDNKGLLTFIATNNWITNSGASKFRNKVLKETKIVEFIDFGDYKIFESAGIQTMVMFLEKRRDNDKYSCTYSKILDKKIKRSELEAFLIKVNSDKFIFYEAIIDKKDLLNKPIHFLEKKIAIILDKIKSKANFKLKASEVAQGIVPNPDVVSKKSLEKIQIERRLKYGIRAGSPVFVIPKNYFKNLTNEEKKLLKPLYEPTELKKYYFPQSNTLEIIYLTKKNDIKSKPNLLFHLSKFKEIMQDRRETRAGKLKYYHLHWPREKHFFDTGNKILSLRKTTLPTFIFTSKPAYVMMAINVIKSTRINLKYLTALLNSQLIAFWLKYKGKMQGDNYQIDKEPLLSIPIIKIENSKPFEILVDYIIFLKSQPNDNKSFYFEQVIDGLVYELYFKEEIKKAGCDILKYLNDLPEITEDMPDKKKMGIISKVFNELYDKESPVRKALFFMDSVEEVAIIKKSLKDEEDTKATRKTDKKDRNQQL